MKGEIIAIGDEIISGKVLNINSNFSARALFTAGYTISRITSVGDDIEEIKEALNEAIRRSNFVIVSGGLGPTPDDITNEAVSYALSLSLKENASISELLDRCAAERSYRLNTIQRKKLSFLPDGASPLLPNSHCAGYMLEHKGRLLFFLPGVPLELEEQIKNAVLPCLRKNLPPEDTVEQKTFRLFGLLETEIESLIAPSLSREKGISIGYYPRFPEVLLTITAQDKSEVEAKKRLDKALSYVKESLYEYIVAEDDRTLEESLGKLLLSRKKKISIAESCTGGLIASRITKVSGSSQWFDRAFITYSNCSKTQMLGVKEETISKFGAVSAETCLEMTKGAIIRSEADLAVAVTGIAGPTGGSHEKPVGTVFIGIGYRDKKENSIIKDEYPDYSHDNGLITVKIDDINMIKIIIKQFKFCGSREEVQTMTAETALDIVRRLLVNR